MRLVFLDAATVDLGDIDLSPIRRLGEYRGYRETSPLQTLRRSRSSDVIITNKCLLTEKELRELPRLRLICVAATGVNNVALAAARRLKIAVANVAGYATTTVAERTILFLLAMAHRLGAHQRAVADGAWSRSRHFAWLGRPFSDLNGKILGVVGYGHIGRRVARLARALGMKVLIAKMPGRRYPHAPKRCSLRDVLRTSDFVTLHCPLTETTRHLINRGTLKDMKAGACLLNLARGSVVDEKAVVEALRGGRLAGYAADVLTREPPSTRDPLLSRRMRDNVLITPHVAWASHESRQRLVDEIAANIRAFQRGRRRNRVV